MVNSRILARVMSQAESALAKERDAEIAATRRNALHIRLSDPDLDAVRAMAEREQRPVASMLAILVREAMGRRAKTELRLILAMAPSFQGGHSKTGAEVAEYLDVPFPIRISDLERKALAHGFEPDDLWPWLREVRAG